jgi:hypothetical protein
MNFKLLENNTNNILINLNKLTKNISVLKKKIVMVNNINKKLEENKILKQDNNNNLSFQSDILTNEFYYYTNMYDYILQHYSKELYEITEYILIILISLNKLEIDNNYKKQTVYNKIIFTKRTNKISCGKLKELINSIFNNIKIVEEFIQLFDMYINKLEKDNKDKNIHNNNFELNINYKKEAIVLEYTKYCNKFIKSIDYFKECLESIIKQIEISPLLKFFLKLKATI